MQNKRSKRSRIRAAKKTAGHGSKKKNRGSGQRGGFGRSNIGKRGSAKLMKIGKGLTQQDYLGKYGFKSIQKKENNKEKAINLEQLQNRLLNLENQGLVKKDNNIYFIDLTELGYDKLLSKGNVLYNMHVKVSKASQNVISKIEEKGGKVELLN
ncbi:MAG: uL15 family ribosomal protein [Candidatus Woesearchaeota archaeon]